MGVILTSNLSWSANTEFVIQKCNKKTWMLRRLKKLGTRHDDLIDVFVKQIRSIAEFAVPVWNSSLTGEEISSLERIQKTALHIILGDQYHSYSSALRTSWQAKLSERRRKICKNLQKRLRKFYNWFRPNTRKEIRLKQPTFCTFVWKKQRFQKSPLSYLTNLLNTK